MVMTSKTTLVLKMSNTPVLNSANSSENPERQDRFPSPRSFYGAGKFRYAVYPDYWKPQWGPKPQLGTVWADDEFYAIREAYNRKLLTLNYTFGPKVVKLEQKIKPYTREARPASTNS